MRKIILLDYQSNCRMFKPVAKISKLFAALLIIFKVPTKLLSALYPAKFEILQQNHSFRARIKIFTIRIKKKFI